MKWLFVILCSISVLSAAERNVLVEVFTNSHCTVCPAAHAALSSYASSSPHASRVRYIFYHTTFPYNDDPLSQANTTEPNARNSYYNGPTSTPNTYFDGVNQGRTYSSFATNLNSRLSVASPLSLGVTGTKNGTTLSVSVAVTQTAAIAQNDLVIHIVAVENVSYVGRNGVTPQNFVMRKMITPSAGQSIALQMGGTVTVNATAAITNATNANELGVVVFVQSVSTKEVYQSEYISYGALTAVRADEPSVPNAFTVEQNFPNPFNPSTVITYTIPAAGRVQVTVHDLLGKEAAVLVDAPAAAGTHKVRWNAAASSAGIYFYTVRYGGTSVTRKMLLIR